MTTSKADQDVELSPEIWTMRDRVPYVTLMLHEMWKIISIGDAEDLARAIAAAEAEGRKLMPLLGCKTEN